MKFIHANVKINIIKKAGIFSITLKSISKEYCNIV
jgi:hypothetical protein